MTLNEVHHYDCGLSAARANTREYGLDYAMDQLADVNERLRPHYAAGMCDALLDIVQLREELAPGCYRVRPLRGAE